MTTQSCRAGISDVHVSHGVTRDGDTYARYYIEASERDRPQAYPGPTITYTLVIINGERPDGSGGAKPYLGARSDEDRYFGANHHTDYVIDGTPYASEQLRTELITRASRRALEDGADRYLVLREAKIALPDTHPDSPPT